MLHLNNNWDGLNHNPFSHCKILPSLTSVSMSIFSCRVVMALKWPFALEGSFIMETQNLHSWAFYTYKLFPMTGVGCSAWVQRAITKGVQALSPTTAPLTSVEPCRFLPAENLALWIGFTWCVGFVLAGVSFTWCELGRRSWISEHHCLTHYSDYWTLGYYLVVFFFVGGGACPQPIPISRHRTLKTFWLKNKDWLLF